MKQWKIAVSSADAAPLTAPILMIGDVASNLRKAGALGFQAIEVHTREDAALDYEGIAKAAEESGCKVGMIITGRLNTEGKCDLMSDIPYITKAAIDGMKQYIDMAAKIGAEGIVVGWVKGNVPAGGDRAKYMDRLARNFKILNDYGKEKNIKLNIEVINRYEVNVFTTAEETMSFLEAHPELDNCYAHLDTFHMNIDECDPVAAIRRCKGRLGYFHLADNSRRYPGSGQLDFKTQFEALEEIGYDGYLSIECLPYPTHEEAAEKGIAYVKSIIEG